MVLFELLKTSYTLLCFENVQSLSSSMQTISFLDIASSLGLEKAELEKTLSSLVDSNIIKSESDSYTINTEYANKRRIFRLPTSSVKDHTEKEVIVMTI